MWKLLWTNQVPKPYLLAIYWQAGVENNLPQNSKRGAEGCGLARESVPAGHQSGAE
jgi:hypothetical protein